MDDDPAYWRSLLLSERGQARRDLVVGLALVATAILAAAIGMLGSHAVLTLVTLYVPAALGIGAIVIWRALSRHARASFKLHQLHSRDTGLPVARVVEK